MKPSKGKSYSIVLLWILAHQILYGFILLVLVYEGVVSMDNPPLGVPMWLWTGAGIGLAAGIAVMSLGWLANILGYGGADEALSRP